MSARLMLAALLVASLAQPALAASAGEGSLGVSPAVIDLTAPELLRGQIVEANLRIHNGFAGAREIHVTPEGELASWVSFSEGSIFTLDPGETRVVGVRVSVPKTAENGDYRGLLQVRAQSPAGPSGSGASLSPEVLPALRVRVGGDQLVRFDAEAVAVDDLAPGSPLVVRATVVNTGNVRAQPNVLLTIADDGGAERLRETLVGPALEPRARAQIEVPTRGSLPEGFYVASVQVAPDQAWPPVPFEVRSTAPPATATQTPVGLLESLDVEPQGAIGKPIRLAAEFTNDGEAPIAGARLVAEIYQGDQRVAVITGEPLRVAPGESLDLDAWFTPEDKGHYVVRAHVRYDGIRTGLLEETSLVVEQGAKTPDGAPGGAGATPGSSSASARGSDAAAVKPTPGPAVALVALAVVAALVIRRRA